MILSGQKDVSPHNTHITPRATDPPWRTPKALEQSTEHRSPSQGHLTWVILARSSEGRCSWTSSGLRRLTPTFLSLRTQGCERLRERPAARRPSSGVEAGVLLAEGAPDSEHEKRSCEQDRDLCMSTLCPPCPPAADFLGWPPGRPGRAGCSPQSALERAGRLKLELLCMVATPLE